MYNNKTDKEQVDGFLHSQTGVESTNPNVRIYKQHYDSLRNPQSIADAFAGNGLFLLAVLGLAGFVAFSVLSSMNPQGAFRYASVVFLVVIAGFVLARFLPGFARAIKLLWISFAIIVGLLLLLRLAYFSISETFEVPEMLLRKGYRALAAVREWTSLSSVFDVIFPPNETTLDAQSLNLTLLLYIVGFFLIALLPFVRRQSFSSIFMITLAASVTMLYLLI